MSGNNIRDIEMAVVFAKQMAISEGVAPESIDTVASTYAALQLMEAKNMVVFPPSIHTIESLPHEIPESFGEWALRYDLNSHGDRFVAIAAYVLKQGKQCLTTADLVQMYAKARWKKPVNFADIIAKSAAKMLFVEAEDADILSSLKCWRITRTGLNYLESLKMEIEYE